ncbi:MAG: ribonuclease P protein component [Flavobacteriaceae bacterium]|nr:ribonuclease P protein component [Flavobacteriaceae bacterium]
MDITFSNKEKLKSKKLIEKLFAEGKSVSVYPLRLMFIKSTFDEDTKIKVGVSVSKRNFKNAVDRNRIKRLLREVYRLNKGLYFNNITTQYAFMILYIGNEKPEFKSLETKMKLLFQQFLNKVSND